MIAFLILLMIVVGVALLVHASRAHRDARALEHSAAHPIDQRLELVWRRAERPPRHRRGSEAFVRAATPRVLEVLEHHGEPPQLIIQSWGLLVVTSGRTLLFRGTNGPVQEVLHDGAQTAIRVSGPNDPSPHVEIANGGRIIHLRCSSIDDAQLICGVVDCWAENPDHVAHPGVIVSPRHVQVPDDFFVDLLHAAGRPATPTNMRSIHERVGAMLLIKAYNLFRDRGDDRAAGQLTERAGRPHDDRDLPTWTTRVLESWIALDPKVAYMGSFALAQVRSILLESMHTGGYFAGDPRRPLSMWQSDRYEPAQGM